MDSAKCRLCSGQVEPALDFGPQPVSCHFLEPTGQPAAVHRLALGLCDTCATTQLVQPFPATALTPRHAWVTYREPEDHLDDLVRQILTLDGVTPDSVIGGISFKDRTTIERFDRLGFPKTWCLDVRRDLGARDPNANIESVYTLLTPEKAAQIVDRQGQADIVVARHVFEHAAEPRRLLDALFCLVRDGGYLVLEVPDSEKNMVRQDYTMIWEEHVLYFTKETFRQVLTDDRFSAVHAATYPYFFEDCLVQIARKGPVQATTRPPLADKRAAEQVFASYVRAFPDWTARYRRAITKLARGAPAAIYGAGHLTAAFVNFHGLADLFAFVIDDTPEKQGLSLPGSGLEIVPRERLVQEGIKLCLLGLSPHIEDKILQKNEDYLRQGGIFHSMFVDSPRSLRAVS